MYKRLSRRVVLLLIFVFGFIQGAPLAYALQPDSGQASAQVYETLRAIDTGDIPPLHPLLDINTAPQQSYSLTTQADGTVVLSAFTASDAQPAALNEVYAPNDNVFRLKQFAAGLMLVLGGASGLFFMRGKSLSLKPDRLSPAGLEHTGAHSPAYY